MKKSLLLSLIFATALFAGCTAEPSGSQENPAPAIQNTNSAATNNDQSSDGDNWIFTTQIDKMNDTVKRRLVSKSINGQREYTVTGYCDDFRMGLTLTPSNFDINEISWRYGLPGFDVPFIKVGMRAGNSSASTFALRGDTDIHILLNSREQKDYSIILDRPNTLSQIASDPEFKRISTNLLEYLKGTFEGDKLLFNGIFPDEAIEFSAPNESPAAREFIETCSAQINKLNSNSAQSASETNAEQSSSVEQQTTSRLTETIALDSLEASDSGDGFSFRTLSGKSYFVPSNADMVTPGADLIQDATINQLPICITISDNVVVKIDSGPCS